MALRVKDHTNVLPADISSDFPSYACLLGNLLEAAGVAVSQPGSFAWVKEQSTSFCTIFNFYLCTHISLEPFLMIAKTSVAHNLDV